MNSVESKEREISERTSTLDVCIRDLTGTTTIITTHIEASNPILGLG